MAIQLINVGNIANDGTGDDLREAMIKINQNFEELDLRDDEQTTVTNLGFGFGGGVEGLFAQKINYDLQFKSLIGGTDISLSSTDTAITINADGGIKSITLASDGNSKELTDSDTITIAGGNQIGTVLIDDVLYVSYNGPLGLSDDTSPELSGNLVANNFNIVGVGILSATQMLGPVVGDVIGNVTGLVHGVDVRNLDNALSSFDNGSIINRASNVIEWLVATNDFDLGTINNPATIESDFGSLV